MLPLVAGVTWGAPTASAMDRLCDPGDEDCRQILLTYIANETVGIDVAFWFMEDARYTAALAAKVREGVPVRVLMDTRANSSYPLNVTRLQELQDAGIPMRRRLTNYILHWKMMLFAGQGVVEFSGANYSADAWRPATTTDYEDYVDEAIYFTDTTSVVNSFKTKFDDHWTNTTEWTDYANVTTPLVRKYPTYTKDPELNFPPTENYRTRSVGRYNLEQTAIDVIMYRITDRAHTDAIIRAIERGVQVRLITEPKQYRDPTRLWHSWNVDRLYMAGALIKHRAHAGLNHQKSVILRSQGMVIFGSSNWTSPSAAGQVEHNIFTTKPAILTWFENQFDRKWNNTGGVVENTDFAPLPPNTATKPSPANGATGVGTTVTLKWYGGPWAHVYDVYFGTTATPPLVAADLALGPSQSSTQLQSYAVPTTLVAGTTYYWRIVSKTMANMQRSTAVFSFSTAGSAPPPPSGGTLGQGDILLYAGHAATAAGAWRVVSDSTAAGGVRMTHPNAGAARITTASATPANYFEMTFDAEAGRGYHLWVRGKADQDSYINDSVFVQFSGSVTSGGSPTWRIGTTSATEVNLEDCSGCGVAGWGWQDNAFGVGVSPTLVYFATTGPQTIRVQTREDGFSIDQIMLSPTAYLSTRPGLLKNDATIYPETGGAAPPPPPPPSSTDVVIYAAQDAATLRGAWRVESDATAIGGSKVRHPNAGAAKVASAAATPLNFVDLPFNAEAGRGYRIWVRGRADSNSWANDSVFLQFSASVDSGGTPVWRIGTTDATPMNLEDCNGCGLSGWGWQDNGYGANVMGPPVYFASTGQQMLRVQTREDGLSIDQIVLSSSTYLSVAPGSLTNDNTFITR